MLIDNKEKKNISVSINTRTFIIMEKLNTGHQELSVCVSKHIIGDHMNRRSNVTF